MDGGTTSGLLGVFIGGSLTIIAVLVSRRAERRNTLNRVIAEKRLDAYEEVIANVQRASVGFYEHTTGASVKWPIVFDNPDSFGKWTVEFTALCSKTWHLVHEALAYRMWVVQNYVLQLDSDLDAHRDPRTSRVNEEALREVGKIVYKDIRKLTSEIVREASRFFTREIYKLKFFPATLRQGHPEWTLPEDYKKLSIIARHADIVAVLRAHQETNL